MQARGRHLTLFHGTVNVVPLLLSVPVVVTVHDLSFLRHPERLPRTKARYLRAAVDASVRKAARVIAVSQHTKCELMDLMRVPESHIDVVHSGVHERFQPRVAGPIARPIPVGERPYVLHVGTLEPRKNIDVLIRAFAELRRAHQLPHALVLVGAKGWMYDNLFELVARLRLEKDVYFVDYVAPDELPLWYNCADLFVYPSVYEGFGLPLLEAMASGVPCVTGAAGATAEVAGSACVTVEPGSQEALQMAINRVLTDGALRSELRSAGPQRASQFSWGRTAQQTLDVYRRAVGQTRA
jgi:glycosyltransferase involved in cell wall biosynthesis